MAQIDEDWLEHASQQSDRECAADHHDRERPLGLRAPIPRRQRRRQEPQGIDEVGRHRRAKLPYPFGTLDDGFDEGMSLIPKLTDIGAQRIATKFDPRQPS
jgi:hypothetical protein